jgi:translocator protein
MKTLTAKIIICVLLCLGLGIGSGFSTVDAIQNWYQFVNKPSWNPPNWLFGPVWTVLYIMMGISVALVWHTRHAAAKKAITVFCIQFALNLGWSFLFFNMHQPLLAFIEIIAMWCFIVYTIILFARIHKSAAYLLLPYISWVSFAAILNYTIWQLNS